MTNNQKMMLIVVVGAFLAIGTGLLLGTGKKATKIDDSDYVLVSRIDLRPGTFIKINDELSYADFSHKEPKPEWMRKKSTNVNLFEGAVVRSLMRAGEPLDKSKIVTPQDGGFMSSVLYPGMRAISVGVNVVSANAGFIFPGDRVDLLLTHEVDNAQTNVKTHVTETVVEGVRVLAIDQTVTNPDNKAVVPKTVTLEVTPKQAEEILVAQELGRISLILRSQSSVGAEVLTQKTFTRDSDISKVIGESRPVNAGSSVTVTRGHVGSLK